MKNIMTLQALAKFCQDNQLYSFNAKDTDTQLVVTVPAMFADDDMEYDDGFLHVLLRCCHTELNRNGSYISEENMSKAMPTLKNRPVLAAIHLCDTGEYEFHAHDIEIDKDGSVTYVEQQVGSFTEADPYLEYNEEYDKTYVMAHAVIPLGYTEAANIIKRHNGTKVSVELFINELSYNAKENYIELIDFVFGACTLLGYEKDGITEIGEGMLGSRLDIADFSIKRGSYEQKFAMTNGLDYSIANKMIEVFEKLNTTLSDFNINHNSQKGGAGMSKLEELIEQYQVTIDDIKFETEGMTDDELEKAFADAFKQDADVVKSTHSISVNGKTYSFELSLNEKLNALESLVNNTYAEADNTYYGVVVYEKYVVMHDYWSGRAYRQDYKCRKDTYSLSGDRVEVYANYLTKDEETELEKIRSNYADLQAFKANIELEAERKHKLNILDDAKYASVRELQEFKDLVSEDNIDKYSAEEIEIKAKVILADNFDATFNFNQGDKHEGRVGISYQSADDTRPYGDLFDH